MLAVPFSTPENPTLVPARDSVRIDANGKWFEMGEDFHVSLAHRPTLGRVLLYLAQNPGPITSVQLFEAAWPGERVVSTRAATNRVYVAIHSLRRMGLFDVLVCGRQGYALDAAISIVDETVISSAA